MMGSSERLQATLGSERAMTAAPSSVPGFTAPLARAKAVALRSADRALDHLRARRRFVSLSAFGLAAVLAYAAAFLTRFDFAWPTHYSDVFWATVGLLVLVRVWAAFACGLDAHRWRFVGASDVRRLVVAVASGTVVFVAAVYTLGFEPAVPRSVLLLEPLLTVLLSAGLWLGYRSLYELIARNDAVGGSLRKVLVVGAGEAGEGLVRQMLMHPGGYRPVAFADDDVGRQGTSVHGVKVMGGTGDLERIVARSGANEIVIALPSAEPTDLRRIVESCQPTGLPFRVLPHIRQVLDGDVSLSQLRDVQIEDLLGREPITLDLPELARELEDQVVLITGAAGSIGSELARQVAHNRPGRLLLLDQSETGLFFVEMELREAAPDVDIVCIVADVVDPGSMEHTFVRHRPDWVFHAAAYKHVPMMEGNEREALRNNVVGTWRVAEAAGRHGVDRFVLVSTDKAVRPANIMGATKRAAELVILQLQERFPQTAYGAVRFGNVLGSAGSVVPVFKRLLEAGKPLTVTHADVTRYFMTIPEAAQLVLQASLLPELRGRIAMLDMGEPVRILDLARTLIRLSGGGRGKDPIVITGLRPGEKLHEELVAPEEEAQPTRIPKVNILQPDPAASRKNLLARLDNWDGLLSDCLLEPVLYELMQMVPHLKEKRPLEPVPPFSRRERPWRVPASRRERTSPAEQYDLARLLQGDQLGYPWGQPGFIERRHPSSQTEEASDVPQRRAADAGEEPRRRASDFYGPASELWDTPVM